MKVRRAELMNLEHLTEHFNVRHMPMKFHTGRDLKKIDRISKQDRSAWLAYHRRLHLTGEYQHHHEEAE